MFTYNTRLAANSLAGAISGQSQRDEISSFFKGGRATLTLKNPTHPNEEYTVFVPNGGRFGSINLSKKSIDSSNFLKRLISSPETPSAVRFDLEELDMAVNQNTGLILTIINNAAKINESALIYNEYPTSVYWGIIQHEYATKKIKLRPIVDKTMMEIRTFIREH